MPILEALFSDPVNNVVMKIYRVIEKALNLLCNLDMAKKKQPRTDLRSTLTSSKKSIK